MTHNELIQPESEHALFVPRASIAEDADGYVVQLDLPGAEASGITVEYDQGELAVRARVEKRLPAGARALLGEYETGDFERTFNVTDSIDAARISAEFRDGVLTLMLPKTEAAKPRRIEVKAG